MSEARKDSSHPSLKLTDFDSIRAAFKNGTIQSAKNEDLSGAVATLANTGILNDNVRHEAIVMADAIHSILFHRLLEEQEKRNNRTQFWFMILAIASLISSIVQIALAIFAAKQ